MVGIGATDLDFGVEALDVDLGGGQGLLSDRQALADTVDF